MKQKDILKNIFRKEESSREDSAHIRRLESLILHKVSKTEPLRKRAVPYWVSRAFATFLLLSVAGTATVAATENPIKERIRQLTERLQSAVEQAQKTGEFRIDKFGQRVFSGKTAEDMERLHNETRDKIIELESRPAAERQKTIVYLQRWIKKYLYTAPNMPKQEAIKYGSIITAPNNGDPTQKVEWYYSQDYEFYIDPETNKIFQVSIRGSRPAEDPKQTYIDNTPRYNEEQLANLATSFIRSQLSGVDLQELSFEKGAKGTNYFFTWTGDNSMKKPLKDQKGFPVCGDVVDPEFYDESGAGCMLQKETMSVPSLKIGMTQGGQLLQYINDGF